MNISAYLTSVDAFLAHQLGFADLAVGTRTLRTARRHPGERRARPLVPAASERTTPGSLRQSLGDVTGRCRLVISAGLGGTRGCSLQGNPPGLGCYPMWMVDLVKTPGSWVTERLSGGFLASPEPAESGPKAGFQQLSSLTKFSSVFYKQ